MKQKIWLMAILILAGCSSDDRLVRVTQQAAQRQAEQNQQMARVTSEVAAASKELVTADAQARHEMAELHHKLGDEQREIGRQRDQLEQERRQIARQRQRDPIVAEALGSIGLILACLLPLGLAALLIWRLRASTDDDAILGQLLVEELLADQPRLLSPPNTVGHIISRPSTLRLADDPSANDPPF